jgi:hypothetical protein
MEKKASKIDIPVLLIFFCRIDPLVKVFEQIKIARPSKLYLYQDGARKNRPDDIENVMKCREIVKEIDWDCKVYYKYQNENFGCDPSEYISQKWMFETEEYGIILEDDDVPSQSFFPFCKEMLEKYKHDERIGIVCGMNTLEISDSPYSYLFAKSGSIWGWATWKRNYDELDSNYTWLNDDYAKKLYKNLVGSKHFKLLFETSKRHKEIGCEHYESILGSYLNLNSKLNIIPTKNMISNIGIGADGTHAVDTIEKLPKAIRKILHMKTYELEFPLKHPKYILEDIEFKKKIERKLGFGFPLVNIYRNLESTIYRIMLGDFQSLKKGLKRRLAKK